MTVVVAGVKKEVEAGTTIAKWTERHARILRLRNHRYHRL